MSKNALEMLGQLVAREIRDSSISNLDRYLNGQFRGQHAAFVRSVFEQHQGDPERLMREMVPLIVDETISIFLQVLDEHLEQVRLMVQEEKGLVSPYQYTDVLEAEYLPEDGWVAQYSKERRTNSE